MLEQVDFPLTNAQLSNFILEKEYTNYFNIQQAINELESTALIRGETIRNSSLFRITPAGSETLSFFENEISEAIKSEILEYLKSNRYSLREEVSTLSDYYEAKKGEFIARCYVLEKDSKIVEINLSVPTEEAAQAVCRSWKNQSAEIYEYLMAKLLQG